LLNKIVGDKFKSSPTIRKWNKVIGKFEHLASLGLHVEEIKKERPEGDVSHSRLKRELASQCPAGTFISQSGRLLRPSRAGKLADRSSHENKYAKHV